MSNQWAWCMPERDARPILGRGRVYRQCARNECTWDQLSHCTLPPCRYLSTLMTSPAHQPLQGTLAKIILLILPLSYTPSSFLNDFCKFPLFYHFFDFLKKGVSFPPFFKNVRNWNFSKITYRLYSIGKFFKNFWKNGGKIQFFASKNFQKEMHFFKINKFPFYFSKLYASFLLFFSKFMFSPIFNTPFF